MVTQRKKYVMRLRLVTVYREAAKYQFDLIVNIFEIWDGLEDQVQAGYFCIRYETFRTGYTAKNLPDSFKWKWKDADFKLDNS